MKNFMAVAAFVKYSCEHGIFLIARTNQERKIEMKKERRHYQSYHIHLLNGEVIEASEAYELPAEKGLIGKFGKAGDNEIFEIGDAISGFAYIPKRSILFITTGDVREEWC